MVSQVKFFLHYIILSKIKNKQKKSFFRSFDIHYYFSFIEGVCFIKTKLDFSSSFFYNMKNLNFNTFIVCCMMKKKYIFYVSNITFFLSFSFFLNINANIYRHLIKLFLQFLMIFFSTCCLLNF